MKKYTIILISIIALFLAISYYYFNHDVWQTAASPHGGKLLVNNSVAAELKLAKKGESTYLLMYVYERGKPVSLNNVKASVLLKRFNDSIDVIQFKPEEDYLISENPIPEPHSFEVSVDLDYKGEKSNWQYENFENRITLSADALKSTGIKTLIVESADIEKTMTVIGKIVPNGDEMSFIYPRFAGIVKAMKKNLGEKVKKGEVIALIESNESLREYSITSPIDGTIVLKNVIPGDMIKEDKAIYQIANLNTVWADLTLYRNEAALIKQGMPVLVVGSNGSPKQSGVIHYISPLGIEDSQTILARVVIANENQEWVPGMYVDATITYAAKNVPLAVLLSAIQRIGNENYVFVNKGNAFEAAPVEIGMKSGDKVEIISGLQAGQTYVADNSYLLKAEIGKSAAEHDH